MRNEQLLQNDCASMNKTLLLEVCLNRKLVKILLVVTPADTCSDGEKKIENA
jgi:hypothetical protein